MADSVVVGAADAVVGEDAIGVVDAEAVVLVAVTVASPVFDDVHEAARTMIAAVIMSVCRNPTIDLATGILRLAPKVGHPEHVGLHAPSI